MAEDFSLHQRSLRSAPCRSRQIFGAGAGAGRPLTSENDRAEILAALRTVDYVTVFDDISPRSLIAELLPDVLVKGGDYALDQIHGREEVEAAGGRVVSLPFVEGMSTSEIVKRIKA